MTGRERTCRGDWHAPGPRSCSALAAEQYLQSSWIDRYCGTVHAMCNTQKAHACASMRGRLPRPLAGNVCVTHTHTHAGPVAGPSDVYQSQGDLVRGNTPPPPPAPLTLAPLRCPFCFFFVLSSPSVGRLRVCVCVCVCYMHVCADVLHARMFVCACVHVCACAGVCVCMHRCDLIACVRKQVDVRTHAHTHTHTHTHTRVTGQVSVPGCKDI